MRTNRRTTSGMIARSREPKLSGRASSTGVQPALSSKIEWIDEIFSSSSGGVLAHDADRRALRAGTTRAHDTQALHEHCTRACKRGHRHRDEETRVEGD